MAIYIKEEDTVDLRSDDEQPEVSDPEEQDDNQDDTVVKIPDNKIPDSLIFRPGNQVLFTDYDAGTLANVAFGTVQYVGVDIGSCSREFVYRIQSDDDSSSSFYAKEPMLHFVQRTAVWAKIATEYVQAIVLSSNKSVGDENPVYCVAEVPRLRLHTCVHGRYVRCRAPGSRKPVDTEESIPVREMPTDRQDPELSIAAQHDLTVLEEEGGTSDASLAGLRSVDGDASTTPAPTLTMEIVQSRDAVNIELPSETTTRRTTGKRFDHRAVLSSKFPQRSKDDIVPEEVGVQQDENETKENMEFAPNHQEDKCIQKSLEPPSKRQKVHLPVQQSSPSSRPTNALLNRIIHIPRCIHDFDRVKQGEPL